MCGINLNSRVINTQSIADVRNKLKFAFDQDA
jgi:hypothetical protein